MSDRVLSAEVDSELLSMIAVLENMRRGETVEWIHRKRPQGWRPFQLNLRDDLTVVRLNFDEHEYRVPPQEITVWAVVSRDGLVVETFTNKVLAEHDTAWRGSNFRIIPLSCQFPVL